MKNPIKEYITKTETEMKNGVKHTTHFVNRPIRPGDPHGGEVGACVYGVNVTIEIINYVYNNQTLNTKNYD